MSVQEAVNAARFHHHWLPDFVIFDEGIVDKEKDSILKSKSYYIISEEEKNMVRTEYKELMGGIKFKAPMNVTLELKHMVEKKYEDYKDVLSTLHLMLHI